MKYKNVELKKNENGEAELFCSVEFKNPNEDEEIVDEMMELLENLFDYFDEYVYFEAVTDDIIQIRSDDITFDEKGVLLLELIYNKLVNTYIDAKIAVNVYVDGDILFVEENGHEYNEDECSFEEFIKNIEY